MKDKSKEYIQRNGYRNSLESPGSLAKEQWCKVNSVKNEVLKVVVRIQEKINVGNIQEGENYRNNW